MIIIGAINTTSRMGKLPDRRKERKQNLNNMINPLDLMCASANNRIHILLSSAHGHSPDRSYVRPQISTDINIDIIQSIFF